MFDSTVSPLQPVTPSGATRPIDHSVEFEVFFDGACPLCRREIDMLRRRDRSGSIRFTNIADDAFDPKSVGRTRAQMMDEIHGRLPDGTVVTGVEVFRRLYTAIGFGWVVAITAIPGISHFMEACYRVFARNRLRMTGRACADDSCEAT